MNSTRTSIALLLCTSLLLLVCRGNAHNAPPAKSSNPKTAKRPAELPPGVIPLSVITAAQDAVEKRHSEIQKILDQKISADFSKLTLQQALDRISERGKLFPVEFGDADRSQRLSDGLKFEATPRREILLRLSTKGGGAFLWSLHNESLKLEFGYTAEAPLVTKTYSVSDLAFPKASRRARREINLLSDLIVPGTPNRRAPDPTDFDWLRRLILDETSGPWRGEDSFGGTIYVANDALRVRNNAQNHAEIQGLLDAVRAAAKGRLRGNMMYFHERGYPAAADAKVIKLWSRRISIGIKNLPLADALKKFSNATGIPIRIEERVLVAEGFDLKAGISFVARNAVAYAALQRMLSAQEPPLTFLLDRGELVISTQVDAAEKLVSAMYDVRDLVRSEASLRQLTQTLKLETSDPWRDVDGTGGTMLFLDEAGALIIRHTYRSHVEIAGFLQNLRKNSMSPRASLVKTKPKNPNELQTRIYLADDAVQAKSLEGVIPVFVAAETWKGAESKAAIRVVDDKLIVRQTVKVHGEIRAFLEDLDAADQTDRLLP